jgi:metal-responsive CopG/Arc/MetJ family transcriptional regulator
MPDKESSKEGIMKKSEERAKVQTTLRLPRALYEQANEFADTGRAQSFNDFIVRAVRAYVEMLRRRRIDAEFSAMATDSTYQRRAERIAEEFSESDWEALETAEKELSGERNAAR